MAYNPGIQDRSGELLAQGISQGFSSLTSGIQKRQNILSEARGRGRALRSTIKGLESLNILPAGISDDLTRAEENSSPTDFLATVNEMSDRISGLITGGVAAQQIEAKKKEQNAVLEQNRLAQQDLANINAPTQSLVQKQIGMNASFEQLSRDPKAFEQGQGTPDLNAKIQRVLAAQNIDPDKKPGIINALIAQNEAGKPLKPQNLGFNEQAVAAEQAAQRASLGRPLTPAEDSAIFREVAGRTNPAESEYGKKVGGAKAEADTRLFESAINAQDNLIKIDETLKYLNKSGAVTGMGAEILNNLNRVQAFFNQQNAAGKKVTDTEMLNSLLGSEVFSMMGSLGVGARGLDTPAEREFLREVMTGTIGNNNETLIRLTNLRKDREERAIEKYNTSVDDGTLDDFFKSSKRPKTKIEFSPKSQPLGKPLSPAEKERLIELGKKR